MKTMKPSLGWAVVNELGMRVSQVYEVKSVLLHIQRPSPRYERVARVEVREVPRKRRARRAR